MGFRVISYQMHKCGQRSRTAAIYALSSPVLPSSVTPVKISRFSPVEMPSWHKHGTESGLESDPD